MNPTTQGRIILELLQANGVFECGCPNCIDQRMRKLLGGRN